MIEPCLPRVLRLIQQHPEKVSVEKIAQRINEDRNYVALALEKLAQRRIIVKEGEFYAYRKTLSSKEFAEKIMAVYDEVTKKRERELLCIGIVAMASQYKYLISSNTLLQTLKMEGFEPEETNGFLEQEIADGRIVGVRIIVGNKSGVFPSIPPFLPSYYIPRYCQHLCLEEYERNKQRWVASGLFILEEDYLAANFPDEIAIQAKEYLDKEMDRVKESLNQKAFQFWYGLRFYGFKFIYSVKIPVCNITH